jgi:hypothetical protein
LRFFSFHPFGSKGYLNEWKKYLVLREENFDSFFCFISSLTLNQKYKFLKCLFKKISPEQKKTFNSFLFSKGYKYHDTWRKAITFNINKKKSYSKYLRVNSKGFEILPYSKHENLEILIYYQGLYYCKGSSILDVKRHKEFNVVVFYRGLYYHKGSIILGVNDNRFSKGSKKIYYYVFSDEIDYNIFCSRIFF